MTKIFPTEQCIGLLATKNDQERATVEWTITLVLDYRVKTKKIIKVQKINSRPRKRLRFKTPEEMFHQSLKCVAFRVEIHPNKLHLKSL